MSATLRAVSALGALLPLLLAGATYRASQSGRGTMHGYVEFEDVAWADVKEKGVHATVELHGNAPSNNKAVYTARTDDHGSYDISAVGMGEYTLRISLAGYRTYQTDLYIPSDFECRLAIILKKARAGNRPLGDAP